MTTREMIKKHRVLWKWLAAHPMASKADAFHALGFVYVRYYCFACHMATDTWIDVSDGHGYRCDYCPLPWATERRSYQCEYSTYGKWLAAHTTNRFGDAATAAMRVACLPLKKWNYGKFSW